MSDKPENAVMTSLSDALGMAPLIVESTTVKEEALPALTDQIVSTEMSEMDKQAEEDFELVRGNQKELIEQGKELFEGISRIAAGSEHPRAFEVAANLLKTLQDANEGLLKLHERRRQLVPEAASDAAPEAGTTNVQNNMFFGTTQQLLDMLENAENLKKGVIEHDSSST